MDFESEFINIDFDGMTECPQDESYIKFKLQYLINTGKRYDEFKELRKRIFTPNVYEKRYINEKENNRQYKQLIIDQRRALVHFLDYIKKM